MKAQVRANGKQFWFPRPRVSGIVAVAIFAASLSACATRSATPPVMTSPQQLPSGGPLDASATHLLRATTPIQHVVIIIQENRSFDNLFNGYPDADTKSSGKDSSGQTIPLTSIPLEAAYDIAHSFSGGFNPAYDKGKMDGFNLEQLSGPGAKQYPNPQYGYVPQGETGPYWSMAQQYVLDDAMFASDIDGSFVAHQFLIAGQANSEVNYPTGLWGCTGGSGDVVYQITQQRTITSKGVPPCQDYQTLGDELDNANLSWATYAPSLGAPQPENDWNGYQAIKHLFDDQSDWKADNISPETQILTDIPAGTLRAVTWVIPELSISDHPYSNTNWGPDWVANVVNAVGQSQFWNSTVIFVLWDDWGGWYDHVAPKYLDYDGLGFRVPMICISPYAYAGKVSHKRYEFGSVLRFVENNFGLGQLAASDTRATAAGNGCLNYNQKARPFVPIQTSRKRSFFVNVPPPHRPPDNQ